MIGGQLARPLSPLAIARPQLKKATYSLSVSVEGRIVPSLLQEFVPARMGRLVAFVHRARLL